MSGDQLFTRTAPPRRAPVIIPRCGTVPRAMFQLCKVRIPTHGAPTSPGEMLLEEFLKPLGMTQTELAERIGVPINRVNEIIKRKRGITVDTAMRLERLFGMDAQFWLNLQLAWELYHAQRARRVPSAPCSDGWHFPRAERHFRSCAVKRIERNWNG